MPKSKSLKKKSPKGVLALLPSLDNRVIVLNEMLQPATKPPISRGSY